ncbi:class 3-domain-containing protein [Baffinella frigidus]|nr:class 3-domain-containing protein [Cryptophyta sp. CCMP2293]
MCRWTVAGSLGSVVESLVAPTPPGEQSSPLQVLIANLEGLESLKTLNLQGVAEQTYGGFTYGGFVEKAKEEEEAAAKAIKGDQADPAAGEGGKAGVPAKEVNASTTSETYQFGDLSRKLFATVQEATSSVALRGAEKGERNSAAAKWSAKEEALQANAGEVPQPKEVEQPEQAAPKEADQGAVHLGFLRAYLSVRLRLVEVLKATMTASESEKSVVDRLKNAAGAEDGWEILVTGHSLGAALATLCAVDLAVLMPETKVRMYNFGSPRVGNKAFADT